MELKVPRIYTINNNTNRLIDRIKRVFKWEPLYNPETITAEEFVAAICANNYKELLNEKNIKSVYEVYVAVMAVTVDKIGVDYYEISLEKSFTNDLGID